MAGIPIPTEESPRNRSLYAGSVAGVATYRTVIDGSQAAGSAHIVDLASATLADVGAEMMRFDMDSTLTLQKIWGQLAVGANTFGLALLFRNTSSAGAAAALLAGDFDAFLLASDIVSLPITPAPTAIYAVGILIPGGTLASTRGVFHVRGLV